MFPTHEQSQTAMRTMTSSSDSLGEMEKQEASFGAIDPLFPWVHPAVSLQLLWFGYSVCSWL